MTTHNEPSIARRPFLRGAGVTLATLGGMTGSAVAKGVGHLADTSADFAVYWSMVSDEANDPNDPGDFGIPPAPSGPTGGPFLGGTDPGGGTGLFDGSTIKITPNHKSLHHSFQLFGGIVMKGEPKPYTLANQGGGVFESRGQTANFEARSLPAIEAGLTNALLALGYEESEATATASQLASNPPFKTLAGEKWRAVAAEQLKVDVNGKEPFDSEWAATRVDIYSRAGDKQEYTLSLLYLLWKNGTTPGMDFAVAQNSLITDGRLNSGGQ